MKNNYSFYKKSIFIFIIVLFGIVIISKFSLNLIKSEIVGTLNSKKFEVFLFNQFNKKLESFSNKEMNDEDYLFYKDNLKKIYLKYGPIFEEIKKDLN